MNMFKNLTTITMLIISAVLIVSVPLFAQESQADALKKAETEMIETFGEVPTIFKVFPEHLRVSGWELMKAHMSPDAAIPAKYSHLIGIAVAAQIPCDYCIHFHTGMVKILGGTDVEINEAIATAADTRHWSTVLNGHNIPFEENVEEWDRIFEHIKKQSKNKKK